MRLVESAKETLEIIAAGAYLAPSGLRVDIRAALDNAVRGTILYTPQALTSLMQPTPVATPIAKGGHGQPPLFEVSADSTSQAGARVVAEGARHVVALNYASAKNPGGGFLGGAKAQEEDLARCSALYTCQLEQPDYYKANRACGTMLYTDHLIYSPAVPFFRDDHLTLLEVAFELSIITSPAPNAGEHYARHPDDQAGVETALRARAAHVLAVARAQGHRTLILGAWGCGVFRNNPVQVAGIFAEHLESTAFSGAFDRVVFAICDRSKSGATYKAFHDRFG